MWAQIGWWLFFTLVGQALAKKPAAPTPAGLADFTVPSVDDGVEYGLAFGTVDIPGPHVAWYGDLRVRAVKKKGGKK